MIVFSENQMETTSVFFPLKMMLLSSHALRVLQVLLFLSFCSRTFLVMIIHRR